MNGEIPRASTLASLRFNLLHVVPGYGQGLFSRRRRWVARLAPLDLDRRTVRLVEQLRRRHGGLIGVRLLASRALLVLDRAAIAEVLGRSPGTYADPRLKRLGMSHFQPHALTISRGEEWADRRRFAEAVLDTGRAVHRHAPRFLEAALSEVAETLGPARPTLEWADLDALFGRVSRQILFGRAARLDETPTRLLATMMRESDRVFGLRRSEHFEPFYRYLEQRLRDAEAEGLVALAAAAEAGERTRVPNQVPHWMFALHGTLAANTARALALIAVHPEIDRRVRAEIAAADLADPHAIARLTLLGGCLQEAMRLWPTTPLLTREALVDDRLGGVEIAAGTQVLILNLFNHRDRETFEWADRFVPEIWSEPEIRARFHHFSGGPQVCPGVDLALLVGQAVLAGLLAAHRYSLDRPALAPGADGGLPYSLDHFQLRWRGTRLER